MASLSRNANTPSRKPTEGTKEKPTSEQAKETEELNLTATTKKTVLEVEALIEYIRTHKDTIWMLEHNEKEDSASITPSRPNKLDGSVTGLIAQRQIAQQHIVQVTLQEVEPYDYTDYLNGNKTITHSLTFVYDEEKYNDGVCHDLYGHEDSLLLKKDLRWIHEVRKAVKWDKKEYLCLTHKQNSDGAFYIFVHNIDISWTQTAADGRTMTMTGRKRLQEGDDYYRFILEKNTGYVLQKIFQPYEGIKNEEDIGCLRYCFYYRVSSLYNDEVTEAIERFE